MPTPPVRPDGPLRELLAFLHAHPRWTRLGVVLLVVIGLRALLPVVLRQAVEWQGTRQLGRVVTVANVDLALLAGGLALEDVAVGPPFEGDEPPPLDPADAHFHAARIAVDWSWLDLARGEIHLERVELASPQVVAVRAADGHLVPVLRPQPKAAVPGAEEAAAREEGESEGGGWPLRLDALRIADLGALFVDLTVAGRRPLELHLDELDLDDLGVRDRQISLGGLGLRAPSLRVRRDIDLAPFLASPAGEAQAAAAPASRPPAKALGYRLARVDLENASFTLVTDRGNIETRLAVHARDVTGERGVRFPLDVRLELADGWFEVKGQTGLLPPAFDGTVAWKGLPLAPLEEAAAPDLAWRIAAGTSSGDLTVAALMSDAPEKVPSRIDVSGRVAVDALDLKAGDGSLAASWAGLEVVARSLALRPDGEGGRPVPPRVELASLVLRDPALRVKRSAASGDGARAEARPGGEAAPAAARPGSATPSSSPRVVLDRLDVAGGRAELVDETVKPALKSSVRDLRVEGRDLRWPERDAGSLAVAFRGPGDAHFDAQGALRGGRGNVALELADLGLAPFSPYSADAAGYWIEGGRVSLKGTVGLAGDRTDVDTRVALHRLDVAEVKPGSFEKDFGVPLDLALALLRDPKGTIALPIGASLEGGATSVSLAPLVAGALRQALVGALSSPIKGLGLGVGVALGKGGAAGAAGDGLQLEPLAAAPGAATLDAAQRETLSQVAKLLEERPGLGVELRGRVGPEDDRPLAERILAEQVVADADLPPVDAGPFQKRRVRSALAKRGAGAREGLDADDAAALERWVDAVPVSDADRRRLATERADAARTALVGELGVAPERVAVGEPATGAPGVAIGLRPLGGSAGADGAGAPSGAAPSQAPSQAP